MQIGIGAWVASWTSLTILLTLVASLVGPGSLDRPSDPVVMIRIPPGPFTMGAEADSWDERPAHTVELRAFEIDKLPVVNAQFAAFLNETVGADGTHGALYDLTDPSAKITRAGGRFAAASGFEQHPVVAETWRGARAFCSWRGARLPTEAEWERAARGPGGRSYPWGNEPPDASRARYAFRIFDYVRVGSYPAGATPEGLLDMAGNVWQWTSSLYRPYPYRADDGREDPNASGERVSRGGGQSSTAEMLRSTYRNVGMSQIPLPPITFRCARDAA
jgi:formylglycine-generating enzyme required for sulfatase activity